jgi:DnaK suppressor protein
VAKSSAKKGAKSPAKKPAPGKSAASKKAPAKGSKGSSKAAAKVKPSPGKSAKPAAKATSDHRKPTKAPSPASTKSSAHAPAKAVTKPVKAPAKPAPKGKESKPTKPAPAPAAASESGRKGITVVNKPAKKPASKPSQIKMPEYGTPLSQTIRKPLIASGPSAPKPKTLAEAASDAPRKSPFGAKELAHYRELLLKKRAELVGDVATMESEALMSQSGSLSNLPQHMAEQGSDAYGQSLSLDLAAADRKLIKEIDDALQRITAGTFGVCELTGKPIRKERLEELPWARYSIEAARELERRSL